MIMRLRCFGVLLCNFCHFIQYHLKKYWETLNEMTEMIHKLPFLSFHSVSFPTGLRVCVNG